MHPSIFLDINIDIDIDFVIDFENAIANNIDIDITFSDFFFCQTSLNIPGLRLQPFIMRCDHESIQIEAIDDVYSSMMSAYSRSPPSLSPAQPCTFVFVFIFVIVFIYIFVFVIIFVIVFIYIFELLKHKY